MKEGCSHVDHDDLSDPFVESRLDQKGYVQNACPVSLHPASHHLPRHGSPHSGMHDPVENFSLLLIVENDIADGLAVELYAVVL